MSNHLTQTQIENYRRRRLSAVELVSVSDHLSACEMCRRQVKRSPNYGVAYLKLKSEVFGEPEILASHTGRAHLTVEQTAEYIDGTLAGEELQVVKDHLTCCKQCQGEINELRAFKDQIAPKLNHEYKPSLTRPATENLGRRLIAALPSRWTKFPVFVFGPALAALLLAVTSWLVWQALQRIKSKPKITVKAPSVLVSPTPGLLAATIIARLYDGGGQVTLDQECRLSGCDYLPPAYQQMVKKALMNQRLERPRVLARLTRSERTPRSGGDDQDGKFSVIEPVGEVTLSELPTFRWSPLDGATAYVVEVYDEQFSLIAASPQIIDHSWTVSQSLKRGRIYSWLVKSVKDGQIFIAPRSPAPPAKFHVLEQAKADELTWARRAYPSSHLTLGLLYVQAGLIDEAQRELRMLQKANPNSEIVRQLLAQVQGLRRS